MFGDPAVLLIYLTCFAKGAVLFYKQNLLVEKRDALDEVFHVIVLRNGHWALREVQLGAFG
jgi:hypothetical protein